jgi:hypothetical protein
MQQGSIVELSEQVTPKKYRGLMGKVTACGENWAQVELEVDQNGFAQFARVRISDLKEVTDGF